jgi:hypothetical protein
MNHRVPSGSPAEPAGPLASRRSLLRGGTFLSLSAVTGMALAQCTGPQAAPPAPAGQAGTHTGKPAQAGHLVLDYQPSQVTGWSPPYTPTLGGHVAAQDFTWQGKTYRISLLRFGQPGHAPNPVYEDVPADATIKFRQTLAKAWGAYYAFRYLGGLPSGAWFTVESYSVKGGKDPQNKSLVAYGGDLYVVYHPGRSRGNPAINSGLQFIQVVWNKGPRNPGSSSFVDTGRANPFYGEGGGLTSIDGNQSVSFYDHAGFGTGATSPLQPNVFRAEAFLAQDTGIKDAAGKDVVKIFGGVKWGWQMQNTP